MQAQKVEIVKPCGITGPYTGRNPYDKLVVISPLDHRTGSNVSE